METAHLEKVEISLMTACGWQDENANIMERDNPVSIGVYQQSVTSQQEAFNLVCAAPELFGCFLNEGCFDLENRWVTLWNRNDRLDPRKDNPFYHKGRFRSPEAMQLIIRNDPDLSQSQKDLFYRDAIEVARRRKGFVNNPLHPRLFRGAVGENDFVRDEKAVLAAAGGAGIFPRYRAQNSLMTAVHWLDDGNSGKIRLRKVAPYGVYQQSVGSLQEAARIALGQNGIAGFCLNDISADINERSVSVKNPANNPFYHIGYVHTPDELRLRVQNAGGMNRDEKWKIERKQIDGHVKNSERPGEGPVYYVNSPAQPNLYRMLEKGDMVLNPETGFTTFRLDLDGRPHAFPLPGLPPQDWGTVIPVDFSRRERSHLLACALV